MKKNLPHVESLYAFKFGALWACFRGQHFSFIMICCYLFFEFVRPQAIIHAINILPYAQIFLLGSMAGAFMDPSVKWVSSAANKLIILFFITILISIFFAMYPAISKKHFMDFFGWFLIYFLIINIVNTKERFYIFLTIYILAAAKIAIGTTKAWVARGFAFRGWGLMGPEGYFQNSGELAILMLMIFPLAFYMYHCLKTKVSSWEKWMLVAFWVCPIMTILGASSRGAQIALVCELLIIFRKSVVRPKAFIGVLLLCTTLFYLVPDEQKTRFSSSGDDKTSQQRLLYWQHGWDMMKEHPWAGVGFFNFSTYYETYYPDDMLFPHAELPHNIFVQVGTDAGFLAVFIFLTLILYCFIVSIKISRNKKISDLERHIAAGLGFGVLGFFIAGQFVTVTYYPFFWIHLAFICALNNTVKINREPKEL